ncbi:uncharacterized protein PY17X_1303600 [Plasmodium yoelii]|uniref:Yir1 protein n=3 Tax=Plasmodium yoelii TaxID=5861 RepID=Q7RQB7_PLAYO|nr:uncharacterized protein PY17X_1303600 [Plasmodium yoelii]EAA20474.1 putative yir1 protein [Plasmodium yoelii yoelii]WBY59678.1 PIR protein [Plasmodium yoelii yoelii]CDU19659.1 YIR protein [Plasmodium yoelii]VTZ80416.1 PIR protein [Plasmodium yoelii]|eukprot:XP_728909.1 uncharacterized protein PY17X_1303600 [Plasmodium yoelii]
MDYKLCGRFDTLKKYLPDELNKSLSYDFHGLGSIRNYCPNGDSKEKECKNEVDKINAACLWLFEQNIVNRISDFNGSNDEKHKVFIIYIMIWLSYMLKLKNVNDFKSLKDFYEDHIKNNSHYTNCKKRNNNNYDDCSSSLNAKTGYNNFMEFIKGNECFMSINITEMSKFYDAFKLLCEMYIGGNIDKSSCIKHLDDGKEFVKKYEKLNEDSSINENSSCSQILTTLSNDYNNFKTKCNEAGCNDYPLLQEKKRAQDSGEVSEVSEASEASEATLSSSSIANKLIPVLLIFVAIPICLGIAYKYSLFGFRKQSKKHLREKLKK